MTRPAVVSSFGGSGFDLAAGLFSLWFKSCPSQLAVTYVPQGRVARQSPSRFTVESPPVSYAQLSPDALTIDPYWVTTSAAQATFCCCAVTVSSSSCRSLLSHWQSSSQDESRCCPLQVLPAAVQLRTQRGLSWPTSDRVNFKCQCRPVHTQQVLPWRRVSL